ncbi:MAG: type I-C CRISPR-associated endonuclease Cas1c [Bacillota bacterium]
MKPLLNTLFVTSEDVYLALDGENVVVKKEDKILHRFPLHNLSGIVCFSYKGASPRLMGVCAERNILLSFCTPSGKFLSRVVGETSGNVLLRREQYRIADDTLRSCNFGKHFIFGKISNARAVIERIRRDHKERIDEDRFKEASQKLKNILPSVLKESDLGVLRGLEGAAATIYFDIYDEMILNHKEDFYFHNRNKRPPLDNVNAMLSFAYSLLANDCASALESVGLDSYVGFVHRDRPGRNSLALDLMEELRACVGDRFVLTLINNRVMSQKHFTQRENGSVLMSDEGRSLFLKHWQQRKLEEIKHPYLDEKIMWGQVPYVQALLLSRCIRGDLDGYPPFLWK